MPVGSLLGGYLDVKKTQSDLGLAELSAEEKKLDIGKKRVELDTRQRLMQMMQESQGGTGQPTRASSKYSNMALRALSFGAVDDAGKLVRMAAGSAIEEKNQIEFTLKQNQLIESKLGGVVDQKTFDETVDYLEETFGPDSGLKGLKYSPQLIQQLRAGLRSAKDDALIDERESRIDLNATRKKLVKVQTSLADARETHTRERTKRLDKAGKPLAGPKLEEQVAARRLITDLYPDISGDALNEASYAVASRAKGLQQKNPALDMDMALRQALRAEDEAGSFASEPRKFFGFDIPTTRKGKFVGGGKSPADALPIPKNAISNKGKGLISGKYYFNDKGDVGLWTGKGFLPVADYDRASQGGPDIRNYYRSREDLDELDELEEDQ